MNDSLMGLREFYGMYLDDIIVHNTSVEYHLVHLHIVLLYLYDCMLSVKCSKHSFLKT